MIEYTINEQVKFTLPEQWNELTSDQLLAYSTLLHPHKHMFIYGDDGQVYVQEGYEDLFNKCMFGLLTVFSKVDVKLFDYGIVHRILFVEQTLNFLFEKYDLIVNPFTQFKLNKVIYVGPSDLEQLSFEELRNCENVYGEILSKREEIKKLKEQRDKYLLAGKNTMVAKQDAEIIYQESRLLSKTKELVAQLYRVPNNIDEDSPEFKGDKRTAYNVFVSNRLIDTFRKLEDYKVNAVLIWYEQARQILPALFPNIFDTPGSESAPLNFAELVLTIGDGVSNFDTIRTAPALLVYTDAERVAKLSKKLKSKTDGNPA